MSRNPHRNLSMPGSVPPRGYSDGTLAAPGRLVFLGGHVAFDAQRTIQHPGELVPQVERALQNLRDTMAEAGALPEHLVKMTVYTLDVPAWHARAADLGRVWRDTLGKIYPAMSLIGVQALYDEGAVVEIEGVAVVPET